SVVLMDSVMAVRRVVALEVAEAHGDEIILVELEAYYVFARYLHCRRRCSISVQYPEFLQMNVDGVLPTSGAVHNVPVFRCVLFHRESDHSAISKLSIDGPLSIAAFELEASCNTGRGKRR